MHSIQLQKTDQVHNTQTQLKDEDFEKFQPFLEWKPFEVIKMTLEATTQWNNIFYLIEMPLQIKILYYESF